MREKVRGGLKQREKEEIQMGQQKKGDSHTRTILNLENFQLPDGYRRSSGHVGHHKSFTSTRTALHRGHRIKIKTTYRIEIDDEPLTLHTGVMHDGSVHCHGLPNYSFPSAIDLAKSIIDAARLASFTLDQIGAGTGDQHHDGRQHSSNNGHGKEDN